MYDTQNLNGLSNIQDEQVYEKADKTGFYRAQVVSNKDPLNLGRVKIRIPSFHGVSSEQSSYVPDAHLPYAFPGAMIGAANHMGSYILPLEGSLVWVSFETGTDNFVYFGGVYCIKPNGDKYIYFNRNVNGGDSIKIDSDDIESDNDPHRYVLFKSIKGSIIYIDDRDATESIHIEDRFNNKIIMNKNGTTINSDTPLKANYPYLITYYMDVDHVSDDVVYTIPTNLIYREQKLSNNIDPVVGAKVAYICNGEIAGSGFIIDVDGYYCTISTNAVMCHKCRLETDGDYLAIYGKRETLTKDDDELIVHGTEEDSIVEGSDIDPETGKDGDQLIIED